MGEDPGREFLSEDCMTNSRIYRGPLVIGNYTEAKMADFSGSYEINQTDDTGAVVWFGCMTVITDDRIQVQSIVDLLNAHKGEWQWKS